MLIFSSLPRPTIVQHCPCKAYAILTQTWFLEFLQGFLDAFCAQFLPDAFPLCACVPHTVCCCVCMCFTALSAVIICGPEQQSSQASMFLLFLFFSAVFSLLGFPQLVRRTSRNTHIAHFLHRDIHNRVILQQQTPWKTPCVVTTEHNHYRTQCPPKQLTPLCSDTERKHALQRHAAETCP